MTNAKKDEGFGSFQIGNMMGNMPGTGPSLNTPSAPVAAIAQTSGVVQGEEDTNDNYPYLAELIEQEEEAIKNFGDEMAVVYNELNALIAKRTGRVKMEAQQALQAYDKTFEMIDYLREVKENLLNPPEAE